MMGIWGGYYIVHVIAIGDNEWMKDPASMTGALMAIAGFCIAIFAGVVVGFMIGEGANSTGKHVEVAVD